MKRLLLLSVALLSMMLQVMRSDAATVSLDNGGKNFGPGSNLNLSAGVANSGNAIATDAYLLITLLL